MGRISSASPHFGSDYSEWVYMVLFGFMSGIYSMGESLKPIARVWEILQFCQMVANVAPHGYMDLNGAHL